MKIQHIKCFLIGLVFLVFSAEPVTKSLWCCYTAKPVKNESISDNKGFFICKNGSDIKMNKRRKLIYI